MNKRVSPPTSATPPRAQRSRRKPQQISSPSRQISPPPQQIIPPTLNVPAPAPAPVPFISGARLREMREERGLTLREIAEAVGVTIQSVHQWEAGTNGPATARLKKLADVLAIEVADLLTEPNLIAMADRTEALGETIGTLDSEALLRVGEFREADLRADTRDLRDIKPFFYWTFARHALLHLPDPRNARLMRFNRDGLIPFVYPGDYIVFDAGEHELHDDMLYVLTDGRSPLIRRLSFLDAEEGGELSVRMWLPNKAIKERVVPRSAITILGAVVGRLSFALESVASN